MTAPLPAVAPRFYAALRAADVDAVVSCFTSDAACNDPVGAPAVVGTDELRAFFTGLLTAFDRFDGLTENETFTAGDSVAVRWTAQGRTKAGETLTFSGIDVLVVGPDGLIQRLDAYYDATAVLTALSA